MRGINSTQQCDGRRAGGVSKRRRRASARGSNMPHLVNVFVTAVVALVRQALGVLVGECRSQAIHNSARREVLRDTDASARSGEKGFASVTTPRHGACGSGKVRYADGAARAKRDNAPPMQSARCRTTAGPSPSRQGRKARGRAAREEWTWWRTGQGKDSTRSSRSTTSNSSS